VSLLGRLEDLSLPDIVQIVYLSRRTGMLELIEGEQRWGIFFLNGLIANAFSPADESLVGYLEHEGLVSDVDAARLRESEERGEVAGDLILAFGVFSPKELAEVIRRRIVSIARPLLSKRTGEFNFILSESIGPVEIGYDVDKLFRQGGVLPSDILGEEGDRARPLQNLEESLRAGKALLKGDPDEKVASSFGFGEEIEQMTAPPQEPPSFAELDVLDKPFPDSEVSAAAADLPAGGVVFDELGAADDGTSAAEEPFGLHEEEQAAGGLESLLDEGEEEGRGPFPEQGDDLRPGAETRSEDQPDLFYPGSDVLSGEIAKVGSQTAPPQARSQVKFTVEGEQRTESEDRNVVVFEKNPLLRVAAKRAFAQEHFNTWQFGNFDEAQKAVRSLLDGNRFFVSFLEIPAGDEERVGQLLQQIKRRNRHLPVVMVDAEASFERRHDLLKIGADLYLTKPSPSHLQPAIADQNLRMFADELVQFADHAARNWQRLAETYGNATHSVGRTLYEIAEKERVNRTRTLMRSLISELTDPDDITQVSQTVLRLAEEYLDRAALFAASPTRFIGLGGFGPTGSGDEMNDRVRRIRIARDDDSVLRDVTRGGAVHRGKLRRTDPNVKLLEGLGSEQPTEVIVIPIINERTPIGVLYGDNAGQKAPIGKTSGLEIFLEQAGLALHNAVVTNAERKGLDWNTR
jgi:DNA-binding response OmpR family regulator